MNTSCILRRWGVCSTILITTVCPIVLAALGSNKEAPRGPVAKRAAKRAKKMVDDIVNRNKPPKFVGRPAGLPSKVALYPESYDWKEEERVRKAIAKLHEDTTVELWEELVRRSADPGYCCIVVVPVDRENPTTYTVGDVCAGLAYARLTGVFARHIPRDSNRNGRALTVDLGFDRLADWRKERMQKSLYQLQIEVGERMVRELSRLKLDGKRLKLDGKWKERIASAREKIEAEIKNLRRTKQPVILKGDKFTDLLYSKEAARRVRDALRRGYTGDIVIFK